MVLSGDASCAIRDRATARMSGTSLGAARPRKSLAELSRRADPLLGTAAPPQEYPWQAHARGLVGHLTYGLVTKASVRVLDRVA